MTHFCDFIETTAPFKGPNGNNVGDVVSEIQSQTKQFKMTFNLINGLGHSAIIIA